MAEETTAPKVAIKDQIASVIREVGMRRRVYPSFIMRKKMSEASAGEEIKRMEAVQRTLIAVAEAALGRPDALNRIIDAKES